MNHFQPVTTNIKFVQANLGWLTSFCQCFKVDIHVTNMLRVNFHLLASIFETWIFFFGGGGVGEGDVFCNCLNKYI